MAIAYAYGGGISPDSAISGTLVLPANGGVVAIPVFLPDALVCQSITCRTTDTTGSHTLETVLYLDQDPLAIAEGSFSSFTFTAAAAAVRTGALQRPASVGPGGVWLVIRNASGTTTTLSTAAAGGLGGNMAATATIATPLGTLLSGVIWTPSASLPLVRLNGSIYAARGAVL
jgi:hypothetical protein